jgi:hypothetical protein
MALQSNRCLKHPFQPGDFPLGIAAIALASFLLSGCVAKFSPLEPCVPPLQTLGDVAAHLSERSPAVGTCLARGDLVLSGARIDGKKSFIADIRYAEPQCLRLRGSHLAVGTLFDVFQEGDRISVKLEKRIFQGSVDELESFPGITGGVEPLEIVRAVLIEQALLEAIERKRAAGLDPADVEFAGQTLVLKREAPLETALGRVRNEYFSIRRRDGLVSEARVELPGGDGSSPRVYTIRYLKYDLEDGVPFPSRFELVCEDPRIRLRVDMEKIRFNPELSGKGFDVDARGCEIFPLSRLAEILAQEP